MATHGARSDQMNRARVMLVSIIFLVVAAVGISVFTFIGVFVILRIA